MITMGYKIDFLLKTNFFSFLSPSGLGKTVKQKVVLFLDSDLFLPEGRQNFLQAWDILSCV